MKKLFVIMLAVSGGLVWAQTNQPSATPAKPPETPQVTEVNSDQADFDMGTREAVYRSHVQVINPKINLTCEYLLLDLPAEGGHVDHILAETNVVIDFVDEKGQKFHVTSNKAVYDYSVADGKTNETVTWTGNPIVVTKDGTIKSEPLIWDRTANQFHFYHYQMVGVPGLLGGTNKADLKLY